MTRLARVTFMTFSVGHRWFLQFRVVFPYFQNVFLAHNETVFKYISTLESLLFTSDVDPHILEVFQQFCALRA